MDFNTFFRYPLDHPFLLAPLVFILGTVVGSLLNVCILRLPLEKSIFWPSSHCGNCLKAIWLRDNLPIIGYLRLRGKCRHCGVAFSSRYMWIEILTGLMFAVTFVYYVTLDVHGGQGTFNNPFGPAGAERTMGVGAWMRLSLVGMWAGHLVLLCCLLVTTFTDIDHRDIPLTITRFGTIAGIVLGMLMPWPWPVQEDFLKLVLANFGTRFAEPIPTAMQFWPWWLPVSMQDWPAPYSWQMGLVNSVLGAAVGTGLVRAIRAVFSWGFRKEAMGLGDADLMMMVGAFLGWQATVLVLICAVFLGIIYVLYLILFSPQRALPFGPFIAGGVLVVLYAWPLAASLFDPKTLREDKILYQHRLLFNSTVVANITVLGVVLMFSMAFILRLFRLVRLAPTRDELRSAAPSPARPRPVPAPMPAAVAAPAPAPAPSTPAPERKEEPRPQPEETHSPNGKGKGKKKRKK
jgi:leader peptidase (prepilin peptidase) / N-methyltransferase